MLNVIDLNLESIKTEEARIINKTTIDGREIKLLLSRKCIPTDNKYIGYCIAEMRPVDELNLDPDDTTFLVKVVMSAKFTRTENNFSEDELLDGVVVQMLPHIRATLASVMASTGIAPYLIPTSGIID